MVFVGEISLINIKEKIKKKEKEKNSIIHKLQNYNILCFTKYKTREECYFFLNISCFFVNSCYNIRSNVEGVIE